MKIVVLTSETPANVWLVNQLMARHQVIGVVVERRPLAVSGGDKMSRRRKLIDRFGLFRTLNKLLYNRLRSGRALERESATLQQLLFPGGAAVAYASEVPTLVVSGINDAECIRFIERLSPDLLAVCGTTVIRPEVFSLAPKGAVNIHTGITPEYRSADPIFWAMYRGDWKNVGVTIHFVDRGIDTGPIIQQRAVPVYRDDSLTSVYHRCIVHGAELYNRALTDIAAGQVQVMRKAGVAGRSYRSVDLGLVQYVAFHLRFAWMARSLPRAQERR